VPPAAISALSSSPLQVAGRTSDWHEGTRHIAPRTFVASREDRASSAAVEADVKRNLWIDPCRSRLTPSERSEWWLQDAPIFRSAVAPTTAESSTAMSLESKWTAVQSEIDAWVFAESVRPTGI
jgi:hypothetical protein